MKTTNFNFNTAFFMCVFALLGSTRADTTIPSIQEQIKVFDTQGSLSNLNELKVEVESLWTNDPVLYFQSNDQLETSLEILAATNSMALLELEKQAQQALNRNCPTNPLIAGDCFAVKQQIATRLINDVTPSISNALLLAEFIGEVRTTTITNYHMANVTMNVTPPLMPKNTNGMGYMSGMNPESISDPIARAAYEKAIADNDNNGKINDLQTHTLPEINRTMTFEFFYYISRLSEKETLTKKQADAIVKTAHLTKEETRGLKGISTKLNSTRQP